MHLIEPETKPAQTAIQVRLSIHPLAHINADLSGFLADRLDALLTQFYSKRMGQKVNVAISELVTNVLQHGTMRESELRVELSIDPACLHIQVSNRTTPEEYQTIRTAIAQLMAAENPQALFARTIHERRKHRLKGGLGLMRLVAENKFQLSTQYLDGMLVIQATFP